jgi:hypothetical protein
MFGSLIKATVGVVLTPVALAVDIVKLPASSYDGKSAFEHTEKMLESVGDNISKALD